MYENTKGSFQVIGNYNLQIAVLHPELSAPDTRASGSKVSDNVIMKLLVLRDTGKVAAVFTLEDAEVRLNGGGTSFSSCSTAPSVMDAQQKVVCVWVARSVTVA